ncbi:hypothetical protein ACN28S_19175 [Cystobacter fuscus]
MDVCVDIFLPRLWPMAGLRQERREFMWEGVVHPQEPETYRWGRQVELRKYAQPPTHLLTRLPQGLFQNGWSYFALEGNGLDLLSREVNGQEVEWDEHPLEVFFLEQLSKNDRWAVVFSPHCDQLDFSQETTAEGFMTLLKAQLNWKQERKGFIAWRRSSSGT